MSVEGGKVTFTGKVANEQQLSTVLNAAKATTGVTDVVNKVQVAGRSMPKPVTVAAPVTTASSTEASEDEGYTPAPMEAPAIGGDKAVSPRDAAITERIISKLSQDKSSGTLRHFELDISTVEGEVWARGHVANAQQKQHVLQSIQRTSGVRKVVDDITVTDQSSVQPASGERPVGSSMPVVGGTPAGVPRAFAPSMLTSGQCATPSYDGGGAAGGPVPMHNGPSYGAGVPRYDQPNMPNYAWPSYAAYPNYAAVTYPKQYSASAWPYIGPFYPYPQVPWDGAKSPSNGMTECGTSTTRASNPPGDQETGRSTGNVANLASDSSCIANRTTGASFFYMLAAKKDRSLPQQPGSIVSIGT